jgi:hypothetical protein
MIRARSLPRIDSQIGAQWSPGSSLPRSGRSTYVAPDVVPATVSEQGVPLPIAYGIVKLPLLLIEKSAPLKISYKDWVPLQTYEVGERVNNAPSLTGIYECYECITHGTSAASGGPTGPGNDITDGTAHWKWLYSWGTDVFGYRQSFLAAICEGAVYEAFSVTVGKNFAYAIDDEYFPMGLLLLKGPDSCDQTVGYQHTAIVCPTSSSGDDSTFYTGSQEEMPDIAVSIKAVTFDTVDNFQNPALIIKDLVTHTRRGCGMPTSVLPAGGWWGSGQSTYLTYCEAAGFRISLVIDSKRPALDVIGDILSATNSDAFWSQGVLQVVPLGDTGIASPRFGADPYVPDMVAKYDLTTNDFLKPITIRRKSNSDCYNCFPVEYSDGSMAGAKTTMEDADQADVDLRGLRRAPNLSINVSYPDQIQAVKLSRILAQRACNVRNEYTILIGWKYVLLDPLDVVTITDSALGLSLVPIRILSIEESITGGLSIIAEDCPLGVSHSDGFTPEANAGYVPSETMTTQQIWSLGDGTRNLDNIYDGSTWRKIAGISSANLATASSVAAAALGPYHINQNEKKTSLFPNAALSVYSLGSSFPPDGWSAASGVWGTDYHQYVGDSKTGIYSLQFAATTLRALHAMISSPVPCATGEILFFEGWYAVGRMNPGDIVGIAIKWYDLADAYLGQWTIFSGVGTSIGAWIQVTGQATVPANAVRMRAYLAKDDPAFLVLFDSFFVTHSIQNKHVDTAAGILGSKLLQGSGPLLHLDVSGIFDDLGNVNDGATYKKVAAVEATTGLITSSSIKSGAVNNAAIGTDAVDSDEIKDGAVGSSEIGSHQVTAAKLSMVLFKARRYSTDQTVTNKSATKIEFNHDVYDPSGTYDAATNFEWTPGAACYVSVKSQVQLVSLGAGGSANLILYSGATPIASGPTIRNDTAGTLTLVRILADFGIVQVGSTDALSVYIYLDDTTDRDVDASVDTFFSGWQIQG